MMTEIKYIHLLRTEVISDAILLGYPYAPINIIPAGDGRGGGVQQGGGDLVVFVGCGVGHLTDLVLTGEGIFESFFLRRGDI